MSHRIHIFGAAGSGATTLGCALAKRLDAVFCDTDAYYWVETDPPYTQKNRPENRVTMIERDISAAENWILSGSICSWGDPLLHRFTLAVFLHLPAFRRMNRILGRERDRYGSRIDTDGDMHKKHIEFVEWARSYDYAAAPTRSLDLHEKWMRRLTCPVLRLDSTAQVEQLCDLVLDYHP